MSKKEKWDGKSRVSNEVYRKNFDEIFGKKEQDELKESYKQSLRNKKERKNSTSRTQVRKKGKTLRDGSN